MKKTFLKAFLALGVLCFVGCVNVNSNNGNSVNDDEGKSSGSGGIDYENHALSGKSGYLVMVKNNTSEKLVAFKGEPAAENLIGGIPASATNHGLPFSSELFPNSQDFILFIVTAEDYQAKKDDLASLKNYPFARLYAYYNSNAKNERAYEISSAMGGNCKIVLNNNTLYNVELRLKDLYGGETIDYTGARTLLTEFKVEAGDYYIFPVFRQFDKTLNEIVTYYPTYSSGEAAGYPICETFALNDDTTAIELNASKWVEGVTFTDGYAYIRINNQSGLAISLYDGTGPVESSTTGNKLINSGSSLTFTLKMDPKSSDKLTERYEYEAFKSYSQFRVGTANKNDFYLTGDSKTTKDFYAGKIYTYTVTGNTTYDLKIGAPTESYVDSNRQKQIEAKEAEQKEAEQKKDEAVAKTDESSDDSNEAKKSDDTKKTEDTKESDSTTENSGNNTTAK